MVRQWLVWLMLVVALGEASSSPSACNNGPYGESSYAFACPDYAMLSDAMIRAAGGDPDLVYATVGASSDSECGACYLVELLDAEIVWRADFPRLVVQVINSGYDVLQGQMDIYMGAGGFGYFTACNTDCGTRYCAGGPCHAAMSRGDYAAWTYSLWEDPNSCYSGGIRMLHRANADDVWSRCGALGAHDEIVRSCARTNLELFHQNFVSTAYRRVRCPMALSNITGMLRSDDTLYPEASADMDLHQSCQGDRANAHFCVTTMQDCCVPSCSWPGKVPTVAGWDSVRACG